MPESKLPPELIEFLETHGFRWSVHSLAETLDLGLDRGDALEVALAASDWKRTRDTQATADDGWVDAFVGRNAAGRRLYIAGKRVYWEEELMWFVITFHEAD